MKGKLTLLSILVLATFCGMAQTIQYVKPTASGTGTGSSWANASTDLQSGTDIYFANIANNTSVLDGAGIYGTGGGAEYHYCILWGNKKGTIENNFGGFANLYYSNVGSYTPSFLSQHDIDQNPLFVDAANPAGTDGILGTTEDGFALSPCSPSINYMPYPNINTSSGYQNTFPASITQDITGNPRRINFFSEMSAYESNSTGLSLPSVFTAKTQDIADTAKIIRINNTGKTIIGQPYPNPTAVATELEINSTENAIWTFSVLDVMGRLVHSFTQNLSKGNHIILLEKLPLGVSYIKIDSGNVHEFRKIIKK